MPQTKITQRLAGALAPLILAGSLAPAAALAATGTPQTFIISAYYSPCADQSVYFRGSFEADKRLNGNGTHGADGTPVYPGMLAAPKSYAFGTQLEIPGLGVGEVHDRGGAIVAAGVRSNAYDRIDVWMGACEDGLARALAWGMRTVTATVYPAGSVPTHFDLPVNKALLARLPAAKTAAVATATPAFQFGADLAAGSSGADVERLQIELKTYGYYRDAISGQFDSATAAAVTQFQLARRLLKNAGDNGAGVFAAATRTALNGEMAAREAKQPPLKNQLAGNLLAATGSRAAADARFPVSLSVGDRGDRVRELQTALAQLGVYDCEVNGIFDDHTASCLAKFQVSRGVIGSATATGAGVFGPKTRAALAGELARQETAQSAKIADALPAGTAQPGDRGETVRKLQTSLKKLGYFAGEPTGEYDAATRTAVADFQVKTGLLGSRDDFGAGFFGAKTRAVLETKLRTAAVAELTVPTNPPLDRQTAAVAAATTPQFARDLAAGASGAEVRTLQLTLQKLGHFAGDPTGTYDTATADAVTRFQLEAGIVKSAAETGAGVLGPRTRAALNATVAREKIALAPAEQAG